MQLDSNSFSARRSTNNSEASPANCRGVAFATIDAATVARVGRPAIRWRQRGGLNLREGRLRTRTAAWRARLMNMNALGLRPIIIIAGVITLATTAQQSSLSAQDRDPQPSDAYAVYSELLRLHKAEFKWTRCAIQRESTLADMEVGCARPRRNQRQYKAEVDAFMKAARKSVSVRATFDPSLGCELISGQQARDAIAAMAAPPPPPTSEPDSTKLARPRPPYRQIFEFSQVGFNPAVNRAIVYFGHHCGGLCGAGALVALQKKNGVWIVDESYEPECWGWVALSTDLVPDKRS